MRILRHILLLAAFGALGAALAVGLSRWVAVDAIASKVSAEPARPQTLTEPAPLPTETHVKAASSRSKPDAQARGSCSSSLACASSSDGVVNHPGDAPRIANPAVRSTAYVAADETQPRSYWKPRGAAVEAPSPAPVTIELREPARLTQTSAAELAPAPLPAPIRLAAGDPIGSVSQLKELLKAVQAAEGGSAARPSAPEPAKSSDNAAPQKSATTKKDRPAIQPTITKLEKSPAGEDRLSIVFPETDVRDILDHLAEYGQRNILIGKGVQGKTSVRLSDVDFDSAIDAILRSCGLVARRDNNFIYVGTQEEFNSIEQAIDRMGTRVYRPNYVAAADLQTLIQPLLTEKLSAISVSAPSENGIQADANTAGGNKFAGGEVVLVRDFEAVLAQVDQVVAEVDVRPTQVAIEAMILSVKLDDEDKLGVNFEFLRNNPNVRLALGTPLAVPGAQLPISTAVPPVASPLTGPGLQFAYLDSNLSSFVDALQSVKETNVIATPRLMALNRQRAEIQIGRKQGYVSQTTQTVGGTTAQVQTLDTGTILRLRPFISSDGLIRIEVHPELSTGDIVVKAGQALPDSDITQVTTNVMVRDGCTVILGGLMREELDNTSDQVPFLGNLPVVGAAFRKKDEKTSRHELLVLLTPHIMYEPASCREGEQAACEFHRRQALAAEKMSPLGKRYVGRKYFRLAQNAWAAGDRTTALRFAEMAVQFDPQNRAAIDLRSDIWQNNPAGGHTLPAGNDPAGGENPLEREQLPDWLLSDLERPPVAQAGPLHPLDPGQPGRQRDITRQRKLQ